MRGMMNVSTVTDTAAMRRNEPPSAAQSLARHRFEYQIRRLHTETRLGRPRAHLDVLVRLCEGLLDDAGAGRMVEQYRLELGRAKAAVSWGAGEVRAVR
jgi:hypothetical protein